MENFVIFLKIKKVIYFMHKVGKALKFRDKIEPPLGGYEKFI